jgi:hypothetical protein
VGPEDPSWWPCILSAWMALRCFPTEYQLCIKNVAESLFLARCSLAEPDFRGG